MHDVRELNMYTLLWWAEGYISYRESISSIRKRKQAHAVLRPLMQVE